MSNLARPFWGWPGWTHLRWAIAVGALGGLWFGLIYGSADWITAHREFRVRVDFPGEIALPFVPEAVLVYMSLYLAFAAAPFVLRTRRELLALALTLNAEILVAGVVFLFVPAQLAFPSASDLGAFPSVFRCADRLNLTYNLLPSLHVALGVTCVAVFAALAAPLGKILLWSWVMLLAVSTVLTHQHHVADAVAGWALGWSGHRWLYPRLERRQSTM